MICPLCICNSHVCLNSTLLGNCKFDLSHFLLNGLYTILPKRPLILFKFKQVCKITYKCFQNHYACLFLCQSRTIHIRRCFTGPLLGSVLMYMHIIKSIRISSLFGDPLWATFCNSLGHNNRCSHSQGQYGVPPTHYTAIRTAYDRCIQR